MLIKIKNKKGEVPVIVLVIGVFLICAIAIISFYFSKSNQNYGLKDVSAMEKCNSEIEKYYFYIGQGYNLSQIQEISIFNIQSDGKLFVEANSFYVKYPFPPQQSQPPPQEPAS